MDNMDYLKKIGLFAGLQETELQKISEITVERKYRKNMVIFMEDEPGEAFFYIKSGKVKVFRTYEDGKEHIIHIFGEGEVFGEATLFSGIPYPASAVAYEDCVIGIIKNNALETLIKDNSELALHIIKIMAKKIIFTQQKLKDLAFNDVFSRTAALLLKLSEEYGTRHDKGILLDIQLSRQELAEMTGTTRETASRVISRFKKERSITEDKDRIIILNPEKLKSWT